MAFEMDYLLFSGDLSYLIVVNRIVQAIHFIYEKLSTNYVVCSATGVCEITKSAVDRFAYTIITHELISLKIVGAIK